MSDRDGNITVEVKVGISFTTELSIPEKSLPYGDIDFIDEYLENEIDNEFGGLDNLEIRWIDIL